MHRYLTSMPPNAACVFLAYQMRQAARPVPLNCTPRHVGISSANCGTIAPLSADLSWSWVTACPDVAIWQMSERRPCS